MPLRRNSPLLRVKDVTVYYDRSVGVQAVSLEVAEGSITALLGANGSGKTTTLRAICGLKPITSGEIWFNGKRIDGSPASDIARLGIGMVPEDRKLFRMMTVKENLRLGAYLKSNKNERSKRLQQVYEYFPRLRERLQQTVLTLSGGEQRMLALARAIMFKPRLLLLDEPLLGLAPLMAAEVINFVKAMSQSGLVSGVLLADANARAVFNVAFQAYVLMSGKIYIEGKATKLIHDARLKEAYLGIE
jgi:branched-chain amino acid transport system ATP-binding protein